jgi:FG-GAP-like repeat
MLSMDRITTPSARSVVAAVAVVSMIGATPMVLAADDPERFHFHRYTLDLDMTPAGPVHTLTLADGSDGFLVHGQRRDSHHVEVFRMEAGVPASATPVGHRDLPESALAFDVDPGGEGRPGRLLILDATGVLAWQPGSEMTRVIDATSLYRGGSNPDLGYLPLLQDLDGDDVDDLLVADFGAWWWSRGQEDGSFTERQLFPLPVLMNASANRVEYRRPEVVFSNGSLVALVEGEVFRSEILGDATPTVSASGLEGAPTYLGRGVIIGDDDADQSDLEESGVYVLDDLTGDGVPDILVQTLRSAGVFDKSSELQIHPGVITDGSLSFAPVATSTVQSEGVQFGVAIRDIDGDGRDDLLAPSVRFSFMRVIGALMSGGFKFKLNFYRQAEVGLYSEEPNFSMNLRMAFDMGSGFVSQPVIGLADLDGDGLTDLIVTGDDGELDLRHGIGGEDLFDDDEETIEVPVPQNGNLVQIVDLDQDEREDMVIRFGPSDPEERRTQLVVLLSRDP